MSDYLNSSLPKTILVTRHDKIGDFILSLPLCKAIKTAYPDICLGMLVSEVNLELAKSLKFIDFVILYSQDFWKIVGEIRDRKPDLSISCYIDCRLAFLLFAAGIPIRIAPATKIAQVFFNRPINQRRSRVEKTEWKYNMDLASSIFQPKPLFFTPPLISFPAIDSQSRRIIFHPGSGGSSEGNLTIVDYLKLARRAASLPGIEVVFTFGPNDQLIIEAIMNGLDFPAKIIDKPLNLIEFCKFISESRLFVSTSTGPMHLAGAVNTPTLSFFGTNLFASDRRWAPVSDTKLQSNFMVSRDYERELFYRIESQMIRLLTQPGQNEGRV